MSEFIHLLRASPVKRVPLDEIKRCYFSLFPEMLNSPERLNRLLQALQELAEQGHLSMPAAGSWERKGSPPLPNWVSVTREKTRADAPDYSDVAWVPELGFWPNLKPMQMADAKAINDFLLRRRDSLIPVPIKERSLEIFGDEKRLDALRTGTSLFAGRLSLRAIGAFLVPLPLPYRQATAPGKPVLVVENHNSFWSFGEWNQTALRYSAVVYGAGEAFRSTGQALNQVLLEVGGHGAEYLGDLDPKGVGIPLDFNRVMADQGLCVRPALGLYQWLLENGRTREKPECRLVAGVLAQDWLGPELGAALALRWERGLWTPQESLGFEHLMTFA